MPLITLSPPPPLSAYASQAMPGGEPELVAYREQLRQSLEMYKVTIATLPLCLYSLSLSPFLFIEFS